MPKRKSTTSKRGSGRPLDAKSQKKRPGPSVKKCRLEPINFELDEVDPIIEDLSKFHWENKANFDVGSELLDQIALEGLNGINLKRLLHMLDAVSPKLNCVRSTQAQDYIWAVICKWMSQPQGVRAYFSEHVPQMSANEAGSSQGSSKSPNKSLLLDKEIKLPKDTIARISKHDSSLYAIQDGSIMGSCQSYLTRLDVTDDLKLISSRSNGSLEALHAINKKYQLDHVFFVAHQEARRRAILPDWSDPNVDIKMREYACLELIGRTRSLGIVFPNDKALGRYRILLTNKRFISQYQPRCTSQIVHHILRFSKQNAGKLDKMKILKGPSITSTLDDDHEVEDEFEDEIAANGIQSMRGICCNPKRLRIDSDMLKMVYHIIAFSRGRSPLDIRHKLRLPKFHVRNHLKNLASIELIGSHMKRIDDQTFRIYRARHKSLVYRRKLREKLQRLRNRDKNKVKFDEVDLKAKSILGARRSHFSQAEDSLLIICRICCLLIEPNLTKKVSFCVNKRFIRDLLHDELFESHDKTADACLRRIKYLRKLPNNIMSVNELTAELRDDPDITRFTQMRESAKTEERLNKLFMQLLKVVRIKLPHLLGLSSSGASGHLISQRQPIRITSYDDLKSKYELIDCQATSTSRYRPNPGTTVLQLAQPIELECNIDLNECNEMPSIALLSSICTHNTFDMSLHLKVPRIIVGLDQGNESYKQLCAKAKSTTRELLSNLTSANPAADSRRALFMLRNELKSQALDKFGNLADALIVQPCNVNFASSEKICFEHKQLIDDFLAQSNFNSARRKVVTKTSTVVHKLTNQIVPDVQKIEREPKINSAKPEGPTRRSTRTRKATAKGQEFINHSLCKQTLPVVQKETHQPSQHTPQPPIALPPQPPGLKFLLKAIEIVLSWLHIMPGIQFEDLLLKVSHLTHSRENLIELLELMKQLEMLSETKLEPSLEQPGSSNVGIFKVSRPTEPILTYEPQSSAYIRFCQLLRLQEMHSQSNAKAPEEANSTEAGGNDEGS